MSGNNEISGVELRILILEDSQQDFELITELLSDAGYNLNVTHAINREEFTSALLENSFNIILSDYNLPAFDAFEALQICKKICPEVPFICISGSIGEVTAIELLKVGAVDYVLKDRPERLPFSVKRALDEAKENAAHIKAAKALQESEYRFKQVAEEAQEWIWEVDVDGLYTYTSPVCYSLLGYTEDEIVGQKHFYDFFVPEKKEELKNAAFEVFSRKESFSHFENPNLHKNGQVKILTTSGSPILDENGNLIGYRGVDTDITERKRIENEFFESQLNFHRSISESPVGIRIVSVEGKTIYANKAFLDIYDFDSLEEFTSTPAIKRYTTESYIEHQKRKELRKNGNELLDYEISIVCKNGNIRHVKVSRKEILWNGTKHFQIINIDITEQRNAEAELRKLSKAVEQSPVAIYITNTDGIIEYVNPKVTQLTGFSAEELIYENTRIFGSGEKQEQEYADLWETIKSGNIWSGEFHNKKKNGELYWESATISPIFDTAGQITHFLAIKEDITDRKRAEIALNKSEELLRKFASHLQNVREEEKVGLAREIHDDLGQTLVALKIDMGLLKNRIIKSGSSNELNDISEGFDNIVRLVDKTIKTARRIMSGLRPELLEMNGFAGAASSYLQEFEDRHQISCEFISDVMNIEMNPQQSLVFFRILQESLSNVAKHSKATRVKIHFRNEPNKLILEIIDNGIGFDKNSSGRQDSYGMIGMKERVVLLKGELDIISEIGKGSCVRVEVPWDIK